MARKIRIESSEYNQTVINKKSKTKLNILLIIITIVSIAVSIGSVVYFNNEIDSLEKEKNKLVREKDNLKTEMDSEKRQLEYLTGDKTTFYVKEKLDFYDENIVFQIEGLGNYYYSYDCMMNKVNGSYTYWAYNKEAAISKGLREGGC